jgi:predicted polyphosphate/ATP-dependent NAD kinase
MPPRIGFIVNPIAGMGGKVGLKGTDGVLEEAIKLGAKPISPKKAGEMLREFVNLSSSSVKWFTCKGKMGEDELNEVGAKDIEIIYKPTTVNTTCEDTKKACKQFLNLNVDLILFCGGDGTARDIFSVVGKKIPILGIPSGVKMHSAVFGITPSASAKMLHEFINQNLTLGEVEIVDLDEDLYRKGEWNIRLFGVAKGIVEPTYVQVGKTFYETLSDSEVKEELAEHIAEEMEENKDFMFLFGPGGTIDYIAKKLDIENTLLGIDAIYQGKNVGKDLNEEKILNLIKRYPKVKVVLSPIGAQGFILGRGNLPLTPRVIREIGLDNIIVVATPSKLADTPYLRVDTGDKELDKKFSEQEFMIVIIGYRLSKVIKIQ